jgi:hypothetical protein
MKKTNLKTYAIQIMCTALFEVEVKADSMEKAIEDGKEIFDNEISGLTMLDGQSPVTGVINMTDSWDKLNN